MARISTNKIKQNKFCLKCGIELTGKWQQKFCSNACSASFNNLGVKRHSKERSKCLNCNTMVKTSQRKFCSKDCNYKFKTRFDENHHQKKTAIRQSMYRAKNLRKLDPSADKEKIKEIYLNCPEGYEVDHIVPLSLGGLHHEDNLQYLTIEENRRKGNRWIG